MNNEQRKLLSKMKRLIKQWFYRFEERKDINYKGNYEEHIIKSINEPDLSIFRKEEIDIINKIQKYFINYKTSEIIEFSHKEKAYIDTKEGSKISYYYAFDLSID